MAKKRKGETISVYLRDELNEYITELARTQTKSKSEIINNIISDARTGGSGVSADSDLLKLLPSESKFTEFEAAFSVIRDYESDLPATTSGYARRWEWSRRQVRNLLKSLKIEIIYLGNKQEGRIRKTE